MVMFGMVINREEKELVFMGPVASTMCNEKDISDYLFAAGLSAKATKSMASYMNANKKFNLYQLQELIVNVNLIINDEIISTDKLISIYDSERANKIKLANKTYNEGEDKEDKINLDEVDRYTNKLNQCIINGDTEMMKELLLSLNTIPYTESQAHSLRDVRVAAIGAIFVAHNVAQRSKTSDADLERIKQFYLLKVLALQQPEEINRSVTQALLEFTRTVKENLTYTTENPTVNRAIRYIEKNITDKLVAQDIASALHISLNYLFTKFKAETGKTLTQYINEEKVKSAIYYLTFTDKSLAEISNHLSFSSQSYFQTVFKSVTGVTPVEYRVKHHV